MTSIDITKPSSDASISISFKGEKQGSFAECMSPTTPTTARLGQLAFESVSSIIDSDHHKLYEQGLPSVTPVSAYPPMSPRFHPEATEFYPSKQFRMPRRASDPEKVRPIETVWSPNAHEADIFSGGSGPSRSPQEGEAPDYAQSSAQGFQFGGNGAFNPYSKLDANAAASSPFAYLAALATAQAQAPGGPTSPSAAAASLLNAALSGSGPAPASQLIDDPRRGVTTRSAPGSISAPVEPDLIQHLSYLLEQKVKLNLFHSLAEELRSSGIPIPHAATAGIPQASAVMPPAAPDAWFVEVEFKRGRKEWFLLDNGLVVNSDEFVFVSADRGEDLGQVVQTIPRSIDGPSPSPDTRGRVLRRAMLQDVQRLSQKQKDELKAFALFKQKVAEHHLDMIAVDAEFQFDRKKLMFHYSSNERIDFRELVRDLYKTYRVRIWMQKVEGDIPAE